MVDRGRRRTFAERTIGGRIVLAFALVAFASRCGGESQRRPSGDDETGGSSGNAGDDAGGSPGASAGTGSGEGGNGEAGSGVAGMGAGGGRPCYDTPLTLEVSSPRTPWLDAGAYHTCLLDRDGKLTCWGSNSFSSSDYYRFGAASPPSGTFTRLTSDWASCALDADGSMSCWGDDGDGIPLEIDGVFADMSVSLLHSCGLYANGTFTCISSDPLETFEPPPGRFVALTPTCALAEDGSVVCRTTGALGDTPCDRFVEITEGEDHACGLRPDGFVVCWGSNRSGKASPPDGTFTQVSAGREHSCGLREDGTVACWGVASRTSVPEGTYTQVSAGLNHTCALRDDDKVVCWGDDSQFQSDPPWRLAAEAETFTSIALAGNSKIPDEESGDGFPLTTSGCGLRMNGSIACWGGGTSAQPGGSFSRIFLGSSTGCAANGGGLSCWDGAAREGVDAPPADIVAAAITDLSFGFMQGCAVVDGDMNCWEGEWDVVGEPPAGTFVAVSVSQNARAPASDVTTLYEHACGLLEDGTAVCWGYDGATATRAVDGPFVEIAAGLKDCARRRDGSVACWDGASGALEPIDGTFTKIGVNTGFHGLRDDGSVLVIDRTGAVSELVDETLVDLAVGGDFACGLTPEGHLRCWGSRVR